MKGSAKNTRKEARLDPAVRKTRQYISAGMAVSRMLTGGYDPQEVGMGYYSDFAIDRVPCYHDHSYFPPQKQLLLRLEELEDRLCALTHRKTGKRDEGEYFSEDDLRYVLPECFLSASNVRRAIELAVADLKERYGICVGDQQAQEEPGDDRLSAMQISFRDILTKQSQGVPLSAA